MHGVKITLNNIKTFPKQNVIVGSQVLAVSSSWFCID